MAVVTFKNKKPIQQRLLQKSSNCHYPCFLAQLQHHDWDLRCSFQRRRTTFFLWSSVIYVKLKINPEVHRWHILLIYNYKAVHLTVELIVIKYFLNREMLFKIYYCEFLWYTYKYYFEWKATINLLYVFSIKL